MKSISSLLGPSMGGILASAAFLLMPATMPAQTSLQATPGNLASQISELSAAERANLVVTGQLDIRDLITLRDDNKQGRILDLSGVDITEYNYARRAYMGRSHFERRRVPGYVFFQAPYEEIILPSTITAIDDGAFAGSEIKSLEIPEGVETIGDYAFYGCPNLEYVVIPSSLKLIGKGAFGNCPRLAALDLGDCKVTAIADKCFAGSIALTDLRLPAGIVSVGSEAFAETGVNELVLPAVKTLAPYALAGMPALQGVVLNKDASFNEGTLMNNGRLVRLSGVPANLPALFAANCYSFEPSEVMGDVDNVGEYAFSNATVTELILAPGLASIGEGAFSGNPSLNFIDATGLKEDVPAVRESSFSGKEPSEVTLKVTANSMPLWQADPVWGQFHIVADGVTAIEEIAELKGKISVSIEGNNLKVQASAPITGGGIYGIGATKLGVIPTGSAEATVSLDEIGENILIVAVSTEEGKKTVKIMR